MSSYESVVVLDPNLADEQAVKEIDAIKERFIKNAGCEVVAVDNWGRRKMAYEINKRREGNYVVYRLAYNATGAAVDFSDIERYLRFAESVMRFLVVRIPDAMLNQPIHRPEAFADIIPTYTPRPRADRPRPPARPAPAAGEEAGAAAAQPAADSAGAPQEGAPVERAGQAMAAVAAPGESTAQGGGEVASETAVTVETKTDSAADNAQTGGDLG